MPAVSIVKFTHVHVTCIICASMFLTSWVDLVQRYQGRSQVLGVGFALAIGPCIYKKISIASGHVVLTDCRALKHGVPLDREIPASYADGTGVHVKLISTQWTNGTALQFAKKVTTTTMDADLHTNLVVTPFGN